MLRYHLPAIATFIETCDVTECRQAFPEMKMSQKEKKSHIKTHQYSCQSSSGSLVLRACAPRAARDPGRRRRGQWGARVHSLLYIFQFVRRTNLCVKSQIDSLQSS